MLDKSIFTALLMLGIGPCQAAAQCLINVPGTQCETVKTSAEPRPSPVEIGEFLDRGAHSILMNIRYYGLPPVSDGWIYMRIENDLYRVDFRTYEVLENVTRWTNNNWR